MTGERDTTSDRQKLYALEKKFNDASRNSAEAEARCEELRKLLFLSEKHWFRTKDTFPAKENFRNENSAFVYCAFSNGDIRWGDYSKVDFPSRSFDKESFNADDTKLVWCYAWMYLPEVPEDS